MKGITCWWWIEVNAMYWNYWLLNHIYIYIYIYINGGVCRAEALPKVTVEEGFGTCQNFILKVIKFLGRGHVVRRAGCGISRATLRERIFLAFVLAHFAGIGL